MSNQACPSCDRVMQRGLRTITLTYKDRSASFDMPGWYCEGCEEGIHTGKDMQESDKQLNLLKASSERLLLPSDIRRIRRKLQLTQELAGKVLGGGPNAFNKYEAGLILPSQAVSNLLRILDNNPDAIAALIDAPNQTGIVQRNATGGAGRRPHAPRKRPVSSVFTG